jgi:molybdate transport system substrate-binding protein
VPSGRSVRKARFGSPGSASGGIRVPIGVVDSKVADETEGSTACFGGIADALQVSKPLRIAMEEASMRHVVSRIAVIALVLGMSSSAFAQTRVTLLVPDPLREEVLAIAKKFEMKTGDIVQVTYGTGVVSRKTVGEGGALDVTLLFAPFDKALASKDCNVDKSTQTVVATVRLAIAVKAGMRKPDLSNAAAVKRLLLGAKSIATVDPNQGSVGGNAMLAFEKMGILDQAKPKITLYPGGGGVMHAVADGKQEVGVGPYLSDYRHILPGLQVAGALPPDAATPVDITGWVSTNPLHRKAAMELLQFVKSKEAARIWEAAKVFPAMK